MVDCRFDFVDFFMIMRLKFSKGMDMSDYVMTGRAQLRERYFPSTKHVLYGDLGKAFKQNE